MKIMIFLCSILLINTNSCDNNIQKENQKKIFSHKQFINDFSFEGLVTEKIYCEKCNLNKYQITIKTNSLTREKVEFSNLSFEPFYKILENNKITFSVTKEVYDSTQKNLQIVKKSGSNGLLIKNKFYPLLNNKKFEWMPN